VLLKVFVDANVLIAGADSRSGASRAVLLMGEIGLIQLVVSRQVLIESERNIRRKLPSALPNFVEQMTYLRLEVVNDPPADASSAWEPLIEAKDAPILAAALAARADRLVTLNSKHFTPTVAARAGIVIQTPAAFIQEARSVFQVGLLDENELE
jgi:predicted nucleic acid-binding protein